MSAKKLATLRAEITTLLDQRADLEDAAITHDEAKARFEHLIARVQADSIKGMGPGSLREGGSEREFAEWLARPGFLCEVFASEIKKALLKRFDAESGETTGLPAGERRKKLAELGAKIYELECAEEVLIEALEADGADIARRPDADPNAQLGLPPGRAAA